MAAYHIANVQLSGFIIGHVDNGIGFLLEPGDQLLSLPIPVTQLHTDEYLCGAITGITIVELSDTAFAYYFAKPMKASRPLRNLHCKKRLSSFAEFRSFSNMAQTVKIDIGAALYGDQIGPFDSFTLHIFFKARDRQCTSRLGNRSRVIKNVLYRSTYLICIDQNHLIHKLAGHTKTLLSYLPDRHAICKYSHLLEFDPAPSLHRSIERRRVIRLNTDNLHLGPYIFDIGRDPGNQPATAHRNKDCQRGLRMLPQQLHPNRALTRDHLRIIKGMNVGQPLLLRQLLGVCIGLVIGVSKQYNLGPKVTHRLYFDGRRRTRHDNKRLNLQLAGRQSDTLGMITSRCSNDPFLPRLRRKTLDLVIGPPQLE